MKSAVIASIFTGTSLIACLVRVADNVSLADHPVSSSVDTTNADNMTAALSSTAGLGESAGVGALCPRLSQAAASVPKPTATRMTAAMVLNREERFMVRIR